jgi:hypothetical protein
MNIYVLPKFLSPEECKMYWDEIVAQTKCVEFTNNGRFKNHMYKDTERTGTFYERLQRYGISDNILRPTDCVMTGFYRPGDNFAMHTDTGSYYNEKTKEKSKWTLLIYLNTVEGEGATVFYDENWNVRQTVYPVQGTAVLFDIDIWHKGEPLQTQEKAWVGCEIIGQM